MYRLESKMAYIGHINHRVDSQQFTYDNLANAQISFGFLCEKQKQTIAKQSKNGKQVSASLTLYDVDADNAIIKEEFN